MTRSSPTGIQGNCATTPARKGTTSGVPAPSPRTESWEAVAMAPSWSPHYSRVGTIAGLLASAMVIAGGKPTPRNTPLAATTPPFNDRAQLAADGIVNADDSAASAVSGRPMTATTAKLIAQNYDPSLVGIAVTSTGLQITVAGRPSATLSQAIAARANGIPVSIRIVQHSEAQLTGVQARITADLGYWTARGVRIAAWGPDLASDKVRLRRRPLRPGTAPRGYWYRRCRQRRRHHRIARTIVPPGGVAMNSPISTTQPTIRPAHLASA